MTEKKADEKRAVTKNKGGRPSLYSPELIERICERLSRGEPLAAICRDEGMPAYRTVKDWQDKMPDVSAAIAHARESGEDWIAAECLQIADTPCPGVMLVEEPNEAGEIVVVERRTADMIHHRKLQIETRLKLLAKWNPKKWGDKVEHSGNGEAPFVLNITKFGDAAKQKDEE